MNEHLLPKNQSFSNKDWKILCDQASDLINQISSINNELIRQVIKYGKIFF